MADPAFLHDGSYHRALGFFAAHWAYAEAAVDLCNAVVLESYGGEALAHSLPHELEERIELFRKAHRTLPALSPFARSGLPLIGRLAALRYDQWKLTFLEQRADGFAVWEEPFVELRLPKLFTLRGDPFERADHEGIGYPRWRIDRAFMLVPAQVYISSWLQSFVAFPPRMKAASFGIDQVMRKIAEGRGSN